MARGRLVVPIPFDPDAEWGSKTVHRVAGTVGAAGVRGSLEPHGDSHGLVLGAAWLRDCGLAAGTSVEVELWPEGPQRDDLPEDIARAFEESPAAGEFFDSLAQFYRKGYLTWISATKRSPEERVRRIAETVRLLEDGQKQRPK